MQVSMVYAGVTFWTGKCDFPLAKEQVRKGPTGYIEVIQLAFQGTEPTISMTHDLVLVGTQAHIVKTRRGQLVFTPKKHL
jgi:hypothetical protein